MGGITSSNWTARALIGLVFVMGAVFGGPAASASATAAGGITTTWDPSTRTISQTYPSYPSGIAEPVSALVDGSPQNSFCPECPADWSEVDRVDLHFPQLYKLLIRPWIFEHASTQIYVYAPAVANSPDVVIGAQLGFDAKPDVPVDRWNASYRIAYVGKTIDFGIDGRADVIVEAGDWSAPQSVLGDGDDFLDLRRMTNLEYAKDKFGNAADWHGGCVCNGGNDRYFGNRNIGRSGADLGPGNDRAWMVTREATSVYAGPGNDIVHGGSGPDRIYGGDALPGGVDILFGHSGQDLLAKYGSGRAILNGGPHSDYLSGGRGNDLLIGGGAPFDRGGGDSLRGAGGSDRYIGSGDRDHVNDPWGVTIANLGGGRDSVVVARGKRHRINCGPSRLDWINIRVRGAIGCERVGWPGGK